jgi:hypothetical protein
LATVRPTHDLIVQMHRQHAERQAAVHDKLMKSTSASQRQQRTSGMPLTA